MDQRIAIFGIMISLAAAVALAQQDYSPHAYQQNDWFLEYGENTAAYINPASIAENDQIEISIGAFQTLGAKAGQEFIAAVHPFDYNHSVGLTIFENGSQLDNSPQRYLENAYIVSYAYRMPWALPNHISHKLALGLNLSLLQFDVFGFDRFFGYGIDLGLGYNAWSNSRYGHMQLGLSLQNVLQPQVKIPSTSEYYNVPRNFNGSVFWRSFNRRLELATSVSVIDLTNDRSESESVGPDIAPSARVTWFFSPYVGLKAKYSKLSYLIGGITVNLKRVNLFRYLQLDLDLSHDAISLEPQDRGFVWNAKLATRVGPTREERIGEARYRRLKIEPENAYREAMRLYLARKFLLASYAFGKVITKYPNFHLVDQAAYYKGKSFENLRMHEAARRVYKNALDKYKESDQVSRYHFQLMNIDYKEGKYAEATQKYQLISNMFPESDVKPDADYVQGQIRYLQKDYHGSIAMLSPILPGNANYIYARYTLGMSYVNLKKPKEAESAFQDIMDTKATNTSEQEMKEITAVKLGHINFGAEPPRLLKAAEYYGTVPSSSQKYDEALLGLAWSFLKVNRPKEAISYAEEIINKRPESYFVPEAHLIVGYCRFLDKDYQSSIGAFDAAIQEAEKKKMSAQEIKKRKAQHEANLDQFLTVQKRALVLSDRLPTKRVLKRRSDLRPKFEDVHQNIENYMSFLREVEQNELFQRNRDRIIRDAKFTKGTVMNILQTGTEKRLPSQQELEDLEIE